jgi:MATE family multidrug resistance protein
VFFSFFMEGFAVTAQSLVGYFLGAGQINLARHASAITTLWSLGIGTLLTGLMLIGTTLIAATFVPAEAVAIFVPAWHIAALAFVTDGIHWGAGDYAYMRNGMIAATVSSAIALFLIDLHLPNALLLVWAATLLWVTVRATFGVVRVWPGVGRAPLRIIPNKVSTPAG